MTGAGTVVGALPVRVAIRGRVYGGPRHGSACRAWKGEPMGFWDSFKAAFLGRDGVVAASKPQTATEAVLVEFHAQFVAVDRVLTIDWPAALHSNDPAAIQATVSRTLPILDRMGAFLNSHHKDVIPLYGAEFVAPYDSAITWYRKAGDAWLKGDVDRASRLLDLAQEDWTRAEESMDQRKGLLGLK
jgi:hypothetical protein